MEPAELQATLRLLAGLLVPCVALLCLLSGVLLLRHRRLIRTPSHTWTGAPGSPAGPLRPLPCACGRGQRRLSPACGAAPAPAPAPAPGAAGASSSSSSSSPRNLEKRPLRVPPNSPAGSWAGGGIPDGTFSRQPTSMQRKIPSCRPAFPTSWHPAPLEYGSSIWCEDHRWTQLNSANFTASQGPGLDSDFGASAGVSLQIMSSDSDETSPAPLLHRQQSAHFEWDYYDPSYKKSTLLQGHLPCICSKQYWL